MNSALLETISVLKDTGKSRKELEVLTKCEVRRVHDWN